MEGELKAKRYRIGKKIPGGGMGDVYQARDIKLDRDVAFKVIKPQYLTDPQFRVRFGREARAAAAVSHPGIAQVHDYEDDGNEAFIVYEFIEGVTLQKRLAERRLTTEEILDVGIRVADALAVVHAKGFVHRDLKPANIMLSPRPDGPDRVRILDFGLVKRLPLAADEVRTAPADALISLTGPGFQPGTIDYMAPEQLRAERVDQRSDIHALGLILYEMATGSNPYRGADSASTIANILTREPPPVTERNPVSPPALERVVLKCLRKDPNERYQSANEVLSDLERVRPVVQPQPLPPPSLPVPAPLPRWVACLLFTVIQIGYLAMYAAAFQYLPENAHRLLKVIQDLGVTQFVEGTLVGLCAAATVRIYLLAAAAFDYEDLGRLFHRIFPLVLIMDLVWAMSPLLLFLKAGFILIMGVPALALLPFSQRYLITCAYGRRGGRSSGVRPSRPFDPKSGPGSASRPGSFPLTPPPSWMAR
ncbi:MAG: serine/threonine protein kinase [Acidobacteriia bacterium]|nr:serine/threonine protein kinase [Terriglobia bacterium]